ncbi:MAG TPA: hypothetical protein HA227_00720 [Candidatus Diapherotrites archaeon]|uniref:Uncharacterized protein n=1 Tax=Candidatus Iainarchaeum sp. TaxID=3101447 RepID=A0A7J4KS95_9ARCH|nr:hypothetical protein [Candidatus Diapherotrites archaeon]
MVFDFNFPQFNLRNASTKEQVIYFLSVEWPLSVKQIYNKVSKESKSGISYQAVHKVVQELVGNKVIERHGTEFSLSKKWIQNNKSFFDGLNLNYSGIPSESVLLFNNLYEVDKFLVELCHKGLVGKKNPEVCLYWNHFWIPLLISKKEYFEIKLLAEMADGYSVTPAKTVLDQWCANFWRKSNLKVKIGVKQNSFADLLVFEDIVVQVFYPKKIKDPLNSFFSKTKKIRDLDREKLFEQIFEKPVKIPVILTVNKWVAEELKNRIKEYFK